MNFYVVNNDLFDDSLFAYGEKFNDVNLSEPIKCEECGSFLTPMKWLPPYEIGISRHKIGDFIFGTFANFIVSSRFRKYFEEENLKGIKSFQPVALYFRKKLLNDEYYYPDVEFTDELVDLKKSGFIFDRPGGCSTCQYAGRIMQDWNGIFFEEPEKIDLDIFNVKVLGTAEIFVSERFRNFVDRHNLSNISTIKSSKFRPAWVLSQAEIESLRLNN